MSQNEAAFSRMMGAARAWGRASDARTRCTGRMGVRTWQAGTGQERTGCMRSTLDELIGAGGPVVADGGMGTMLFARGLERGTAPELWNVERPDEVRAVHEAYIEAGAQIVLTNTFGGNPIRLSMHGLGERAHELNLAAARLARQAADAADLPVAVGGSMGPTGQMLAPLGDLEFEAAAEAFEVQAAALAEGGVDVFWIETMADVEEVRAAVEGCRRARRACRWWQR